MKRIISIGLVIIVFASVFVFASIMFGHIFNQYSKYNANVIGAFSGAFFAYVFLRIGDFFVRLYDRKKKHYDTLIKLEHIYNSYLDLISGNIYEIQQFKGITPHIKNNEPVITFNRLNTLPISEDLLLNLSNIGLINEAFSYNIDISKLNNSMESLNRFYDDIKNGFIDKKINFKTYQTNFLVLFNKLLELEKFLVKLDEKTERMVAIVEVLAEDKPLLSYFIGKGPLLQKLSKPIEQRIIRLKEERRKIEEKSKKEIQETLATRSKSN